MPTCVIPTMWLVDKMADFTSLLFESINLIPHPLGITGVCLDLQDRFLVGNTRRRRRRIERVGPMWPQSSNRHVPT